MQTGLRRKVLGAFGVVSVGLLATSTAYACTTYKGQVTATGNHSSNVSETAHGTNSGMNWCAVPVGTATVIASNATLKLETSASNACASSTHKMTAVGLYNTAVVSGFMGQGGRPDSSHNCHGNKGVVVNTGGTVDANGVWTANGGGNTVSFTTTVGDKNVCIYNTTLFPDAIAINFKASV